MTRNPILIWHWLPAVCESPDVNHMFLSSGCVLLLKNLMLAAGENHWKLDVILKGNPLRHSFDWLVDHKLAISCFNLIDLHFPGKKQEDHPFPKKEPCHKNHGGFVLFTQKQNSRRLPRLASAEVPVLGDGAVYRRWVTSVLTVAYSIHWGVFPMAIPKWMRKIPLTWMRTVGSPW